MIKRIFIYWDQGFNNAPMLVKKCLFNWKVHNPTWEITELDHTNLKNYIDIEAEIPDIKRKKISRTAYSDIVRIFLLQKYGGCWCDATTFCTFSLDMWLNKCIGSGFFGFRIYNDRRLLSSWFLYSEKGHYLVNKWKEQTIKYWKVHNERTDYYWFHYQFTKIYKNDARFKRIWDSVPHVTADGPHYLLKFGILKRLTPHIKQVIDDKKSPVFKLTYKYDKPKFNRNKGCVLRYLLGTVGNIKLIHIGKCGGSFLEKKLNMIGKYHMKRDYKSGEEYIIWIRNPLKRFISAFWYSHTLINFDTSKLNINNLTIDNCLAPGKIRNKMLNGVTFDKIYDNLINHFKTPNRLAEALTSTDTGERKKAVELMTNHNQHIFKGIGWYLYNGEFVKRNHKKILFVGRQENMKEDIVKLGKILKTNNLNEFVRSGGNYDFDLSEKAVNNLLDFYKKTDYEALRTLMEFGFITKEIFEEYHKI